MPDFNTAPHFDRDVRIRHVESNRIDWIEHVLREPNEVVPDPGHPGRTRHWGYIAEAEKYIRVVTESDGTVLTAFFDGNYTRRRQRKEPS